MSAWGSADPRGTGHLSGAGQPGPRQGRACWSLPQPLLPVPPSVLCPTQPAAPGIQTWGNPSNTGRRVCHKNPDTRRVCGLSSPLCFPTLVRCRLGRLPPNSGLQASLVQFYRPLHSKGKPLACSKPRISISRSAPRSATKVSTRPRVPCELQPGDRGLYSQTLQAQRDCSCHVCTLLRSALLVQRSVLKSGPVPVLWRHR